MSLVDRWLLQPPRDLSVATTTLSATPRQNPCVSLAPNVASCLRQAATFPEAEPEPAQMSQPVAPNLRHEKPQNSKVIRVISQLSRMSQGANFAAAQLEPLDEVVEHDGKNRRAWAEGFVRLDPDRPPGDVPLRRWQTFINDVTLFLDSPFCADAVALGWGPFDLFGCDRDRPFARIDHLGLLWRLNGDTLVELNRHTAVIERRTGARQTFRRRPVAVGEIVLAWELIK